MDDELKLPPESSTRIVPSTLAEVQTGIETIKGLDLRVVSIEEIKELLLPLWKGHQFVAPIIPSGLSLYRLRAFPDEKPGNVSEIGAPPGNSIKQHQRCNRLGESLFYCSTARNAPFFELHVQVGQKVVLSTWKTTKRLLVNRVGYTQAAFSALRAARDCPTWHSNTEPVVETEANRTVEEFLAERFTSGVQPGDEHLYKLTIAVSEKLLHGGNFSFDGLLYPTIPMWGNADNLALTAASVSCGLEFTRAEYLQITRIEGSVVTFEVFDAATALAQDGAIPWKGHGDRWTLRKQGDRLTLSCEDGRWVARDTSGRIVEPD